MSASAIQYLVEEDFSDANLSNWTLGGSDWTDSWNSVGVDPTVEIDHTFEVNNELKSSGEFDRDKYNVAYRDNPTSFGAWSFEVNYPNKSFREQIGQFGFYLTVNPILLGNHSGHDGFNLTGAENFHFAISDSVIKFGQLSTAGTLIPKSERGYDESKHFDIIHTEDQILVYINNQVAMERNISAGAYNSLNFVTLVSAQGSNTIFDDFKITSDYVGRMEEIEAELTDTTTEPVFLLGTLLSASILVGVTIFYSNKILKKKASKDN